jgi:VanZ family protein
LLGLLGHGALTEFLQQFVEGRTGTLFDVGLDTIGVLVGLAIGLGVRQFRHRA